MAIRGYSLRVALWGTALFVTAIIAFACGRGGPAVAPPVVEQPVEVNMEEALAELDALPTPAGVDASMFAQLKEELRRQLSARGKAVMIASPFAVNDLAVISGGGGEMPRVRWSSDFFVADGDNSGVVSIADLTPIAVWFGADTAETPLASVADYTRDGTVAISDVTPLAMHFGERVTDFRLESAPAADGEFAPLTTVLWEDQLAEKNVNGFAVFEYELAAGDFGGAAGLWVRVVSRDGAGGEGDPCEAVHVAAPNSAPTAMLVADPVSGEAPLEVSFDASGSSDEDGSIVQFDYDWEGDGTYDLLDGGETPAHTYDTEGDYDATVRVTDNLGATATATALISVSPGTGNEPPVAGLLADPTEGSAPLTVSFDASGSYDPDNEVPPARGIVQFEWDWEGDGTYDESGVSPTIQHTYNEPGMVPFNATVRVTDAEDATATDSIAISVLPGGSPPEIVSVSPLAGEEGAEVTLAATVTGTQPFDYFWELVEPTSWATPDYVEGSGSVVEATVTLGSAGVYTLTLNVANGAGAHERDFTFTINEPGTEWNIYPVEESMSVTYSSLAVVGGKPGIAYFDSGSQDLFYAYCSTSDGTGAWSSVTVDSKGMGMGDVGTYCSLAQVAGGPAISYYEGGIDQNLKFAYNPNADGSGSWGAYRVDSDGDAGWITSVAEVNGKPAIGYFGDDTSLDFKYAYNSASDGGGTWTATAVETVESGMFADGRVLCLVDGRPAVAFYNWADGELQFSINASADGTGAWSTSTVNSDRGLFVSMGVIDDGKPAIAYRDFSGSGLKIAVNSATDGSGTWNVYTIDGSAAAQYTSVGEVGGYPAVAYRDFNTDTLHYAVCNTADGSGTWTISTVDSGSSILYVSLLEVAGRACITYAKTATGVLCFARRNS